MNKNILVIDDDEHMLETYRNILTKPKDITSKMKILGNITEEKGDFFNVVTSNSGKGAIQVVKESLKNNTPFTCAFVDMRMPPGIDGLETATIIRKIDPRIYIIIVTAFSDRSIDEINEALKLNVILIRKPASDEVIFQLARNFCNSWRKDLQLKELKNKLMHAERLATIGEMTASITHEISQPLQHIKMMANYIELLATDNIKSNEIKNYAQQINSSISKLYNIIKNTCSVARKDTPVLMGKVDIIPLTIETIQLFSTQLYENDIEIVQEIDDNVIKLYINKQSYIQIITNLLSNAIFALSQKDSQTKKIFIRLLKKENDKLIVLEIEDTGIGMSEKVQQNCLNAFYTTKPENKGTGLGLSIVLRIL